MSLIQVQNALEKFATASDDRAIVLKGAWGTGKTFLWNRVVQQKKEKFAKPKYSYVSLFGINSLADLKRQIFESSVDKGTADTPITFDGLVNNLDVLKSKATSAVKKVSSHTADLVSTVLKGLGPTIDSVQFAMVSETLICIDDFERKGSSLNDRDVLGLISQLVEKRNCRVILILNDKTLDKKAEFFSFNEKVFDYEITFSPTVEEASALVFDSGSETDRKLIYNCKGLEINNVRLLKKIKLFVEILTPYFEKWELEVTYQALHVLPLAVLAIYGGKESLADIEVITSLEQRHIEWSGEAENKTEEEKAAQKILNDKMAFLTSYDFGACDEFDLAIIDIVKQGYADDDKLSAMVEALHKKIKYDKDFAALNTAWAIFRDSFELNDAEIFAAFEHALSLTLCNLSIQQLDSVSFIYDALDKEDLFKRHVDAYFKYAVGKGSFEHDEHSGRQPKHPYLVQSLVDFEKNIIVHRPLSDILENWPDYGSVEDEDILSLSRAATEEYYNYFKSLRGREVGAFVGRCLKLGSSGSSSFDMQLPFKHILVNSYEAILKISSESNMNAERTSRYRSVYAKTYQEAKRYIANPPVYDIEEA